MATSTVHLKIPDIDGDSVAAGFEDQIDCSGWGWGASQAANMHMATGGAAGGSTVNDIHFTKSIDKASSNLMAACCEGKHIPEAVMTCTKSGAGQKKWLEITMKKVIISSIQFSGQEGSQGEESMTLNFGEFMMKFFPQTDEGEEDASIDNGFNIKTQERV